MIPKYLEIRSNCGYSKCWPWESWRTTHQKHQKRVNHCWPHLNGRIFVHPMDLMNPWLLMVAICCYIFVDARKQGPKQIEMLLGPGSMAMQGLESSQWLSIVKPLDTSAMLLHWVYRPNILLGPETKQGSLRLYIHSVYLYTRDITWLYWLISIWPFGP